MVNGKKMAYFYLFKGRFWFDFLASLPFDELFALFSRDARINKKKLKFMSMLKLIRILRLGRMITFLRMKQSYKFGLKSFELTLFLVLMLHWITCIWHFIIQVNSIWYLPKDNGLSDTIIYDTDI